MLEHYKSTRGFIVFMLAMMMPVAGVFSWVSFELAGTGAAIAVFVVIATWSGGLKAFGYLLGVQVEINTIERTRREKAQAQKGALTMNANECVGGALTLREVGDE